jgi:fructose-1,6-bisphosphatase/inositol monophosphatase family enzyme
LLDDAKDILDRLMAFQAKVRDAVCKSQEQSAVAGADGAGLSDVSRTSSADTIYAIDEVVEPLLEEFCEQWSQTTPLVLIAEGLESRDESGKVVEGIAVYPRGTKEADAQLRMIVDPIDGTREFMYDKRSAWALAAVAPNRGPLTRLRDVELAVMTELPTSKMSRADVLWAIKGQKPAGKRVDLETGAQRALALCPSRAKSIDHGFATVSNFFPGTKQLASELMERIVARLVGPADVTRATVFDDQYICTGGQFYELIVGHDRFNADLRPLFYQAQGQPQGLCCHPYDCAALLIAEQAGVIITDGAGRPLDAPLDCTTGVSWVGYANADLRAAIEPVLREFLKEHKAI